MSLDIGLIRTHKTGMKVIWAEICDTLLLSDSGLLRYSTLTVLNVIAKGEAVSIVTYEPGPFPPSEGCLLTLRQIIGGKRTEVTQHVKTRKPTREII